MAHLGWGTVLLLVACAGPMNGRDESTPVLAAALDAPFRASPINSSLAADANTKPLTADIASERVGGSRAGRLWLPSAERVHARHAVATANPLASAAARLVLRRGGSAVDAAIAAQMVLTLVEPQSSGIGGGAFLMHWDGAAVQAWDGRETAPAGVDESLFLKLDGQPMAFMEAAVGGRAVGVPGTVRMLEAVHAKHGRLPWASLFDSAIQLADAGFAVSPRLHALLTSETALRQDVLAKDYFYPTGTQAAPVGMILKNPALATIFRQLAASGSKALHEGPIAADVVRRVKAHAVNPGQLSATDLAQYQARERPALCTNWGSRYRLCGFPPPSSGHLAMAQMLGTLACFAGEAGALTPEGTSVDWLHRYLEVSKLAFADRAAYVADPDFVEQADQLWSAMVAPRYLCERARLISPTAMKSATPGQPLTMTPVAMQSTDHERGTTHLSIVDERGQAVSMTSTIEAGFGARVMSDGGTGQAGGFLLNNQLTDFSFAPRDAAGKPIANRVQAGKRPRSSMSPTLVFDRNTGALVMSLGSPGGAAIIHYTTKTLLATLAHGLSPQEAADLPNFANFNGPALLETGRFDPITLKALRDRGHVVNEVELTSGIQALQRVGKGWRGGADGRREGQVLGD